MFKVAEICEELDYTELYKAYVRMWRKVNPVTLFEIPLFLKKQTLLLLLILRRFGAISMTLLHRLRIGIQLILMLLIGKQVRANLDI